MQGAKIKTGPEHQILLHRPSEISTTLQCIPIFIIGYFFSTWFLEIYQWGDQEHYDKFWRAMTWADPSQWSALQYRYLSSAEPLYQFIIGVGTYFDLDRISYISVWNALLLSSIGYALIKNRSSVLFGIFVFTNYYILVLLGPAERLKFAYLFLILAFCVEGTRWKTVFAIVSVFFHTQAIVQFISSSIYFVATNYKRIVKKKMNVFGLFVIAPSALAAAVYYLLTSSGDVIARKAEYYGDESQGVLEIIQWAIILFCGMLVFNRRIQFLFGMLPMGLLTALYGGRINVATLTFFCVLALTQRKTSHPLVLAVMFYMSFKSMGFIEKVLSTGQGF